MQHPVKHLWFLKAPVETVAKFSQITGQMLGADAMVETPDIALDISDQTFYIGKSILDMTEFTVTTREGRFDISATVRLIGTDLLVAIWGGDSPHIGAVAAAQPRPSLRDPEVTSATASVICYVGHKEDSMAKAASEYLAAAFNTRVVVTAGIHWDNLTDENIRQVIKNGDVLVEMIRQQCMDTFFADTDN